MRSKYDLYSKSKVRINLEEVKPYYLSLIQKVPLISILTKLNLSLVLYIYIYKQKYYLIVISDLYVRCSTFRPS